MSMHMDEQIVAEHEAWERVALAGIPMSPRQLAAWHRQSAVNESRKLLDLMAARDAAESDGIRDQLAREINESQAFIEVRLAKASELEALPAQLAAAE